VRAVVRHFAETTFIRQVPAAARFPSHNHFEPGSLLCRQRSPIAHLLLRRIIFCHHLKRWTLYPKRWRYLLELSTIASFNNISTFAVLPTTAEITRILTLEAIPRHAT
jgi:hypothetical protein